MYNFFSKKIFFHLKIPGYVWYIIHSRLIQIYSKYGFSLRKDFEEWLKRRQIREVRADLLQKASVRVNAPVCVTNPAEA